MLSKFIWRHKTHYIKTIKNINNGGLKTLDVKSMTGMFSVNWMKAFKKVGELNFLLKCDFDVRNDLWGCWIFLHFWEVIFSHNFTPHGSSLLNNRRTPKEGLIWLQLVNLCIIHSFPFKLTFTIHFLLLQTLIFFYFMKSSMYYVLIRNMEKYVVVSNATPPDEPNTKHAFSFKHTCRSCQIWKEMAKCKLVIESTTTKLTIKHSAANTL